MRLKLYKKQFKQITVTQPMFHQKEQDTTFRTNRTFTTYNINDYLPSSTQLQSKNTLSHNNKRDKMSTEPTDYKNKPSSYEVNQLNRKNQLLEEQKSIMKREIEKLKGSLMDKSKIIEKKEEEIYKLLQANERWMKTVEGMKSKISRIGLCRNNIHFINFPKHKQLYQVSVQTDPIIDNFTSIKQETKAEHLQTSNKDLETIYQKLQNLKMPKKMKQNMPKSQVFMNNKTTMYTKGLVPSWRNSQEKQNDMRISNLNPSQIKTQKERVYEQTIQLWAVQQNQVEHLINVYLQSY